VDNRIEQLETSRGSRESDSSSSNQESPFRGEISPSFIRGEKFLARLDKYKNEFQWQVGKRKLTSKPRFLTGYGKTFGVNDRTTSPQIRYHDLEDILSSNEIPEPGEEIPRMGRLSVSDGDDSVSSVDLNDNNNNVNYDSLYPSDPSSQSIDLDVDNVKVRVRPPSTKSPQASYNKRRSTGQMGKPRGVDSNGKPIKPKILTRMSVMHPDALNVVYLSPEQFREDMQLKFSMETLGTKRRSSIYRRQSSSISNNTPQWFEPERDTKKEDLSVVNLHAEQSSTIEEENPALCINKRRSLITSPQFSSLDDDDQSQNQSHNSKDNPPLELVYLKGSREASFVNKNSLFQHGNDIESTIEENKQREESALNFILLSEEDSQKYSNTPRIMTSTREEIRDADIIDSTTVEAATDEREFSTEEGNEEMNYIDDDDEEEEKEKTYEKEEEENNQINRIEYKSKNQRIYTDKSYNKSDVNNERDVDELQSVSGESGEGIDSDEERAKNTNSFESVSVNSMTPAVN